MRNRIVFFTHSNYHFMLALSVIIENFNDSERFDVIVFKTYRKHYDKNLDLSHINGNIEYLDRSWSNINQLSDATKTKIGRIANANVSHFFLFNEDEFIGVYLSIILGRKGTEIGLVQDGTKAYAVITKKALRYRVLRTLEFYKFLKENDFKRNFWYFFNIHYGRAKFVRKLWLTFPKFNLCKTKEAKQVRFGLDDGNLEIFAKVFKYNWDSVNKSNVIFFISSIVRENDKVFDIESRIIEALKLKFVNVPIYLKLHPRTPNSVAENLKKIPNVLIIQNEMPAELYLGQLQNSIVISAYSSALLYNNVSCNFYWLMPLYREYLPTFSYTQIINPTEHIKIIDSINEVEFKPTV